MTHSKSRNNRKRLRSRMSRRRSKKGKIIRKGGGKFGFELKLYRTGVLITDLLTNKKYFFENSVQHFAQQIYFLVTSKNVNDDKDYLTKNSTIFSTDNENTYQEIVSMLERNKSEVL